MAAERKKQTKQYGTPPTQFRLEDEDKANLDLIQTHYGLTSRAAAMRLAAKREADRVRKAERSGS